MEVSFGVETIASSTGKEIFSCLFVVLGISYMYIIRPMRDQSQQMKINVGLVITQVVDLDFETKSLSMNIEFMMDWVDELIAIKNGYGDKVSVYSN